MRAGVHVSAGSPPRRASASAYTAAAIELYSRLWAELEPLSELVAAARLASGPRERLELALVVLRLELVVLLDACDSRALRSMLLGEHRLELRATLESVLAILAAPAAGGWPAALAHAQNRLLDAVIGRHAVASRPAEGARHAQLRA